MDKKWREGRGGKGIKKKGEQTERKGEMEGGRERKKRREGRCHGLSVVNRERGIRKVVRRRKKNSSFRRNKG